MEVYPNYNFGQKAGPMPEKYQDKRIIPRVEVATWDVKQKYNNIFELLRSKAFERGACCLYLRHF